MLSITKLKKKTDLIIRIYHKSINYTIIQMHNTTEDSNLHSIYTAHIILILMYSLFQLVINYVEFYRYI